MKRAASIRVKHSSWAEARVFPSIKEFAKFSGLAYQKIVDILHDNSGTYAEYTIERLQQKRIRNAKKGSTKCCPVLCTTTGKKYASIQQVAKKLKVNSWTMGLKMEKAGKFIDKNTGNEYIRLRPLNGKSDYPEQTPFLQKIVRPYTKHKDIVEANTSVFSEEDVSTLSNTTKLLIENKNYNEASSLLNILAKITK